MSRLSPKCAAVALLVSGSLLSALPAVAATERYTCATARVCNASGACQGGSGSTVFELDEREVNRDGEGFYTLKYNDRRVEAYSVTEIGPVIWAEGRNDMQVLTMTGTDTALWQVSDLKSGRTTITFLRCSD